MTSRLKKKLGDLGVDLNSRKASENFCLIGTPLPPLEKSKDTGEFVPLWKQDVRDEKGRRRLHGAFTGGFSAGYFNTVGSKEGWTPSTFVSSRTDRVKKQAARPEDFMDEEDLQEMKERMLMSTTDEPRISSNDGALGLDDDPIAAALQTSAQSKDTPGAKILKKMGWRPGQGLGPRVSLKERKRQDAQAFNPYTGIRTTGNSLDVGSDDEEASKHTYPRRDTPILNVVNQNKHYGLGYKPGLTLNEKLGAEDSAKASGAKISAGFGLGALNDADEDDIDVYDSNLGSRTRTAFDHTDYDQGDTIVIGAKGKERASKPDRPKVHGQTFYNGKAVLAGFTLADQPVQEDTWYAGPEVPADWKPDPRKLWDSSPAMVGVSSSSPAAPGVKDRSQVSAAERGAKLGETPAAAHARSVFDFMSEKDRERIKRIAQSSVPGGTASVPPLPPTSYESPRVDSAIAKAALQGFQPFTKDSAKQARYTAFLQSQVSPDAPPPRALAGQNADEFHKELEDYAKAAVLFKPISGAMAGRFTSAAVLDLGPNVQEGLHQPSQQDYTQKKEEEKKKEEENVSPKVHAARMGMYGPMTRETKSWMPAKLLCKRFGVKEPEPPADDPLNEQPASRPSFTQKAPNEAVAGSSYAESAPVASASSLEATSSATLRQPRKLENIGLGDDETQGADILTYERPSMDLFKAIFASDDEDSDGEEEGNEQKEDGDGAGKLKSLTEELKLQDSGPVDLATFKPTFIPREGKAKASNGDNGEARSKEKREKKDKKKKEKKSVLVSFAMDEDGEEPGLGDPAREKDRPKKKRKDKERKKGEDEDSGMFLDRPPLVPGPGDASRVAGLAADAGRASESTPQISGQRARKRAIDFMDE